MESKGTILVVDDTPLTLKILTKTLVEKDYTVYSADSGESALAYLQENQPDLILLDVIMPGMGGFEVCTKIKANKQLLDIPIIFLTSVTKNEERIKGLNLGAVDFITKPFQNEELLAKVKTHSSLYAYNKLFKKQTAEQLVEKERLLSIQNAELKKLNQELSQKNQQLSEAILKIEKSESTFKKLLEGLTIPVGLVNGEGDIAFINKRFTEIFGYTTEDIPNLKAWWQYAFPDIQYRQWAIQNWSNLVSKDGESNPDIVDEFRITSKEGRLLSVIISGITIGDNFLVTFIDITERKEMEIALQTSENLFHTLAENSPVGIFKTNPEGKTTYVNHKWCEMSGTSFYDAQGFGWLENVHPEDKENVRQIWLESINECKGSNMEYRYLHPDGSITWVIGTSVPEKDAENKIVGYIGTETDITQRKQIELDLKKFQTVIQSSEASIIITDFDGRIEYANPYFSENTGYTPQDYLGKNPRILKTEFHDRAFYQDLWNTIKSGQTWEGEFRNQKKNGDIYWERAVVSPIIDSNNKITHFVAVKMDVSETKKITGELIVAKEKAEQSDRLKTAFLNNISHEIRTPLNGILGFAPFIIQPDITDEEKEEYLEVINVSSYRLMNTVTDIMDISLILSGSMEVHPHPVDISSILTNMFKQFQEPCKKRNLVLNLELPDTNDQIILNTDNEILEKTITKLMDNSMKFTKEGSINLGMELIENEIKIFVKDTGKGIDKEAQERMYRSFMQENISNTRAHEGSGLGLSIAKGMIQLLGGKIQLESTKNVGTSVFLTLPNTTVPALTEPKKVTKTTPTDQKPLILIAEDEESNYLYVEILLKNNYKTLWARNGQEAVELIKKNPGINLVLMDIKMPIMGGLEATRLIKTFRKDLPVIAVTAYAQSGDEFNIKAAGCDEYISKPIDKTKLLSLIRQYTMTSEN